MDIFGWVLLLIIIPFFNSYLLARFHSRSPFPRIQIQPNSNLPKTSFLKPKYTTTHSPPKQELNGSILGPIDRGHLSPTEDALSETALNLGVSTILDKAGVLDKAGNEDVKFSIVAMSLHFEPDDVT